MEGSLPETALVEATAITLADTTTNQVSPLIQQPPLTNFSIFDHLPTELQLKIWKISILEQSERIVELTFERTVRAVVSLTRPPAQLSVNFEARTEALRYLTRLPQPQINPPIYIDLNRDICFIREDTDGFLADQNLLLVSIFGAPNQPPACNLLGMKNLFVDYWVMERGWIDLAPLNKLRGLDKFWVVMANNAPQRVLNNPPNSMPNQAISYNRRRMSDMYYSGQVQHHIADAVDRFWGIGGVQGNYLATDLAQTMDFNVFAEVAQLCQVDPTWIVPPYLLMTYGPY